MAVRRFTEHQENNPRNQVVLYVEGSRNELEYVLGNIIYSDEQISVPSKKLHDVAKFLQSALNILYQMESGEWAGEPKDLQQFVKKLSGPEVASLLVLLRLRVEDDVAQDIQYGLTRQERDLVRLGQKLPAIKMARERTGLGLKEAKDLIDGYSIISALPPPP